MKYNEDGTITHGHYRETPEQFYERITNANKPRSSDEIYTPPRIMEIVEHYVETKFNVSRETMCRPFYPGGDYQHYDYTGKVVVDNPPFSMKAEVLRFYVKEGVPFFLFCDKRTCFESMNDLGVGFVLFRRNITYAPKVEIPTAFVTNLFSGIKIDQELGYTLEPLKEKPKPKRKERQYTSLDLCKYDSQEIPAEWYDFSKECYGGSIILKEGKEVKSND